MGRSSPGSGRLAASTSMALRAARESRAHVSIRTTCCARRHVPRTSPSTSSAPGHTRDVQSLRRRSACGTSNSRSAPSSRKYASPLGSRRAGAGSVSGASISVSSSESSHSSPSGERTRSSVPSSEANAPAPALREIPAQRAKPSAVPGPKTWRYRRASSRRASGASIFGAGTVQTIGARAPSQRIATVPVVAAYLIALPMPSASATSRSVARAPFRYA